MRPRRDVLRGRLIHRPEEDVVAESFCKDHESHDVWTAADAGRAEKIAQTSLWAAWLTRDPAAQRFSGLFVGAGLCLLHIKSIVEIARDCLPEMVRPVDCDEFP